MVFTDGPSSGFSLILPWNDRNLRAGTGRGTRFSGRGCYGDTMNTVIVLAFPFVFVGFWSGVVLLVSVFSGWRALSQDFRCTRPVPPGLPGFQRLRMRAGFHYSGTVSIATDDDGFYLKPMILFRPGHPTLFVPFADCTAERHRQFFFRGWKIIVRGHPEAPIIVSERLFERMCPGYSR